MAGTLDLLIAQSVQRMLSLSASADQMLGVINQADSAITQMTETIEASKQIAQTSFDSFGSKLNEAEQSLQEILQTTLDSFTAMTDRVTQLDEQTETAKSEIKTQLDDVKSFSEESASKVDPTFRRLTNNFWYASVFRRPKALVDGDFRFWTLFLKGLRSIKLPPSSAHDSFARIL